MDVFPYKAWDSTNDRIDGKRDDTLMVLYDAAPHKT